MIFARFTEERAREGERGETTRPEISLETRESTFENLLNNARHAIVLIRSIVSTIYLRLSNNNNNNKAGKKEERRTNLRISMHL